MTRQRKRTTADRLRVTVELSPQQHEEHGDRGSRLTLSMATRQVANQEQQADALREIAKIERSCR